MTRTKKLATPVAPTEEKKKRKTKVAEPVEFTSADSLQLVVMKKRSSGVEALAGRVRSSFEDIKARALKKGANLLAPAELRKSLIPVQDLLMQYALGSVGFRTQSVHQVIGAEGIGKTTVLAYLAGVFMSQDCGVIYINVDNKAMDPARIQPILSRNKNQAVAMINAIMFGTARSVSEVDTEYEALLPEMRAVLDKSPETKGNPIFVIVDDYSAAKSKSEAAGRSTNEKVLKEDAKKSSKTKKKEIGKAESFGHSKHAQAVRRALPEIMETFNASFIFTNAQNDKVDMTAIPGMPAPSKSDNDTTIGGRALKSISSYRWTIIDAGKIKNKSNKHIGTKARMRLIKNSYGPKGRDIEYSLYFDDLDFTRDTNPSIISFADATVAFMVKNKLLGVRLDSKLVTCDELGVVAVSPEEFYSEFIAREDLIAHVGSMLGIEGYARAGSTINVDTAESEEDEDFE